MEPQTVRTRIAPSPTGYPHIGTIYQALFNYAFAKKNNGAFIIRIEDTDRARFVTGAEDVIYSCLDWFGLVENESPRREGNVGPYKQSERLSLYHKYAQELLDKGQAYYSYYPKAEAGVKKDYSKKEGKLPEEKELKEIPKEPTSISEMVEKGEWVIRMRVPKERQVVFRDEIRGDITFEATQVTEQVLIKSDGFPTYHLAVVVDDHLMGITYIVRGEEWITSTPKHVLLYKYFGWALPYFFHTPDLRNPDKSKLSKRHGHTNVNWYREEGYLPEAILNFLALQGWSHPQEKEIFSLKEFIQLFDLKDVKPVGPIFDLKKLEWMNGMYIRELTTENLKQKLQEFYRDDTSIVAWLRDEKSDVLLRLAQTRMKTLKDFKELVSEPVEKYTFSQEEKKLATQLMKTLESIKQWNTEEILTSLKAFRDETKTSWKTIYLLLTGKPQGLPLAEKVEYDGKVETIKRLNQIRK